MELYLKLLFLALISVKFVSCKTPIIRGYNEPCELYDTTSSCDDSVGLICIDSGIKGYRCKCPTDKQFETIYDNSRNKCVGKVFNSCVRDPSFLTGSNTSLNSTLCVENAVCNNAVYYMPICLCRKGYFETDEGSCAPVAKYGESCDNDKSQCDLKNGLACLNDKCGCKESNSNDPQNQFYDSKEEKCISYVGSECSLEENLCVDNAECRKLANFQQKIPNSPRRRNIIFGSSDQNDRPNHHNHLPPARYPLSGTQDSYGKCVCKTGYSPTSGFCMRSYGSICKPMEINRTEVCSPDQFLECMDAHDGHFRCQCRNVLNEKWSDDKKMCVSIIGKKCRSSAAYPACEDGAECVEGICQCRASTSMTPIGGCKLDYNEKCQPGQCNVYRGLTCHGKTGTCLCLDSYLKYSVEKKSCIADRNGACGPVDFMGGKWNGRGIIPERYSWSSGNKGTQMTQGNFGNANPQKIDDDRPFIECENGSICKLIDGKKFYKCVSS